MSEIQFEKFPHPPIKEAVFIVNYSESITSEAIKVFVSNPIITSIFPIQQTAIQKNLKIDGRNEIPKAIFERLQDGYILKSSKDSPEWILQIRQKTMLLHKVKNYSSWENLNQHFKIIIDCFNNTIGRNIKINTLGIRYINHIEIPSKNILPDWFKLLPPAIGGLMPDYNSFLLQMSVTEKQLQGLIIESVSNINEQPTFIIDIRVTDKLDKLFIYSKLENSLNEIRLLKNKLFFNIITDNVKHLFR